MQIENICEHSFVSDNLSSDSMVIDCGINEGDFSRALSGRWGCVIHGMEPDKRLFENLPTLSKCTFHPFALSNKRGKATFNLGGYQGSSLHYKQESESEQIEVETISLPEFCTMNNIEHIDLLKLDIEGAELEVFENLEDDWLIERVEQITVEFHEFLDPSVIPQIEGIVERLKSLGYLYFQFSRTYGDVLFINSKYMNISQSQNLQMKLVKYGRGVVRVIKRVLGS